MPRGEAAEVGTESPTQNGYISVKTPTGWRFKHHIIAEEQLGRPLQEDERVYFIDGDRNNLDPENIEVRYSGHKSRTRKRAMTEIESVRKQVKLLNERLDRLEQRFL